MGKVTFTSYSHIQPREVKEAAAERNHLAADKGYEKRPGAASQLRQRVASLGARISGAMGRHRVESSAQQISGPMNPAAMKAALQNISNKRIASQSVARPAPRAAAGSVAQSAKASATGAADAKGKARTDALALRDALTAGLTKAMQSDRGAALIDTQDVENFVEALSISLGLKDGELQLDQFSGLGAIKYEIEPYLASDVRGKFDQLMSQLEQGLLLKGS